MSETKHFFTHTPLAHKWQLRVVEVLPLKDEHVHCKIHIIPGAEAGELDSESDVAKEDANKRPYDALSYVWGDAKFMHEILIDDKPFLVRDNLFLFLKHAAAKKSSTPPIYWIDAICINQQSVAERNEQVLRMTSIYKHAQQVSIWLGLEEDDSGLVFEHLEQLGAKFTDHPAHTKDLATAARSVHEDMDGAPFGPDPSFNERLWTATAKLLSRDWWSRVWIAQEATVPEQQSWLLCGDSVISWRMLRMGMMVLIFTPRVTEYGSLVTESLLQVVPLAALWEFQVKRSLGGKHLRLLQLIPRFRNFKATNERDRIYALLGMADTSSKPYPVDYRKSEMEVYMDVVKYLAETSDYAHKLDILGYADDYYDSQLGMDANMVSEMTNAAESMLQYMFENQDNPDASTAPIEAYHSFLTEHILPPLQDDLEHLKSSNYGQNIRQDVVDMLEKGMELLSASPEDLDDVEFDMPTLLQNSMQAFASACQSMQGFQDPAVLDSVATRAALDNGQLYLSSLPPIWKAKSNEPNASVAGGQADSTALTSTSIREAQGSTDSWPSWVPDWRRTKSRTQPFKKDFSQSQNSDDGVGPGESVYSASGTTPDFFTAHAAAPLVAFDGLELQIRGFRVDKITTLTPLEMTLNTDKWQELKLLTPVDLNEPYITGESIVDAWYRTAMADLLDNGVDATARRNASGLADHQAAPIEQTYDPFLHCDGRQLALTAGGFLALVSISARLADEIFVLGGGQVLYVLRPQGDSFRLMGECYVHGLMDGEALEMVRDGRAAIETVRIR